MLNRILLIVKLIGGCIALYAILLISLIIYQKTYRGPQLDQSSQMFVRKFIEELSTTWHEKTFINNSIPGIFKPEELRKELKVLRKLGQLKNCIDFKGESHTETYALPYPIKQFLEMQSSARYNCVCLFFNGNSNISIKLILMDGRWLIQNFHIRTEFFKDVQKQL
jgi:hypothetical protein